MALSTFWLPDHYQGIQSFQLGPNPYTHKSNSLCLPSPANIVQPPSFWSKKRAWCAAWYLGTSIPRISETVLRFQLETFRTLRRTVTQGQSYARPTLTDESMGRQQSSPLSFPVKELFFSTASSACPLRERRKPCGVISHRTKLARAPVLDATAPAVRVANNTPWWFFLLFLFALFINFSAPVFHPLNSESQQCDPTSLFPPLWFPFWLHLLSIY